MTKKQLIDEFYRVSEQIWEVHYEMTKAYIKTKFKPYDELANEIRRMRWEIHRPVAKDTKAQLEAKVNQIYELNMKVLKMMVDVNDEYMAHVNRVAAV